MLRLPDSFTPGCELLEPLDEMLWFAFAGHQLLVIEADIPTLPGGAEPPLLDREPLRQVYMGEWSGRPCMALELAETEAPPGMAWQGLRRLWGQLDDDLLGLAGQASQLLEWDRGNRYCGCCASPTERRGDERARHCPQCGARHYPRLAPAVMVRITRSEEILLAHSPRFAPNIYSVLAGFVEPGESIEQTARREVREEVGLEIANLRYFTSQSWPFPHSLMIAFTADYAGGQIVLNDPEIDAADWFTRDRLPGIPQTMSIARALIDDWLHAP